MPRFGAVHIIIFIVTALLIAIGAFIMTKLKKRTQNIVLICLTAICSFGIFFRFAMSLSFTHGISLKPLLLQMLQVCNFNFILLPLALVPRFKILRQYVVFFSMFAAFTALVSPSSSFANNNWYDATVLNSWINHALAVGIPILMLATKRVKPEKKYVLWTAGLVVLYFTLAAIASALLKYYNVIPQNESFSFLSDTMGIALLDFLYYIIPYPYFYLYPLIPPMIGFFYLLAYLFRNYKTKEF